MVKDMTKKRKLKKGLIPKLLILLLSIVLIVVGIVFIVKKIKSTQFKEYTKTLNYMDTVIDIKLYSNNEEEANTIISEIEGIYKYYHELTDKYNSYEGINNIYTINNTKEVSLLEINEDLYNILDYSKNWYYKSNGLFNVNIGKLTDLWKNYRDNNSGIPTNEELIKLSGLDIKDLVLYDDYKILTGKVNLDLGGIAKGYATEVVHYYLNKIGFEKYLINAGGTVLAGKNVKVEDSYKVGIQDPNDSTKIYTTLNLIDKIVTSSGGYERFYEYEGVKYHHIIDPNTKMSANNMKSVTVITEDALLGDVLSTTLFLMTIEQGQEFVKQFENVDVIWYANDDQIIKTDGIKKYE